MSAKRLLQNMKGYKLANNDIDPAQLQSLQKLYGSDEGKVLGSLIMGGKKGSSSSGMESVQKRRKRKRKRNNKKTKCNEETIEVKLVPISCSHGPVGNKLVDYSSEDSCDGEEILKHTKLDLPEFLKEELTTPTTDSAYLKAHTLDSDSDSDTMRFFHTESNSSSSDDPLPSVVNTVTTVAAGTLLSHTCYKCGKIGHLPRDCSVGQDRRHTQFVSHEMKSLFSKCRKLKADKNASCIVCGVHSNLANCLDCGTTVCDGRGHLVSHLLDHPSHTRLFSYKLGKVIKCCKPSCSMVNSYQLLSCSSCFSKIFSQHYSMITATWSATGLRAISNSLCCDEHFQWHRMNCLNASDECLISMEKLKSSCGTLSEFVF